jgi:F-type H+-transporting ATPase subunit delta
MLPQLEGYAAALLGSLDESVLSTVARELSSLEQTILSRSDLRAVLTDTSIAGAARGQVVRELLTAKLNASTVRLVVYAASNVPAQEVPHAVAELALTALVLEETNAWDQGNLGLMAARKRVGGFADEILEKIESSSFARIEEELFRWARTIESNVELRRLLLDRDAPLAARVGATRQLLEGHADPSTLRLAIYVVEGGRPRDVVGTLDFLVDFVAQSRDWRVARVHTARPIDAQSESELVASLTALTGRNVELQVAEEPALLGGVLVEVGDLRLDATTRGRLSELAEAVTSGRFYESSLNRND